MDFSLKVSFEFEIYPHPHYHSHTRRNGNAAHGRNQRDEEDRYILIWRFEAKATHIFHISYLRYQNLQCEEETFANC